MKFEKEFRERCTVRGLDDLAVERAVRQVLELERRQIQRGASLERPILAGVEVMIADAVAAKEAVQEVIMALARYFAVAKEDALAIRLLAYLLPIGVLPTMVERLSALEGDVAAGRVMKGISLPPEGARPEDYPGATKAFVMALETELGPDKARRVLTCNVHGIPPEAFAGERERLLEIGSIDVWLADYHARQMDILKRHVDDGTLWYEQRITPAVVDFVRARQEMLSGVRDGDSIFITKIPYDPDRFIASKDPLERRRLACHCPLAASSITAEGAGVPSSWCACSAGYEKFRFDVIFGEETEATVLASVLAGDELCRFAVKIPASAPH